MLSLFWGGGCFFVRRLGGVSPPGDVFLLWGDPIFAYAWYNIYSRRPPRRQRWAVSALLQEIKISPIRHSLANKTNQTLLPSGGVGGGYLGISIMTKRDLAMAYSPDVSYETARKRLRRWIHGCRPLAQKLQKIGFNERGNNLKNSEVKIIFKFLGRPW